jgi:hypothetical protein
MLTTLWATAMRSERLRWLWVARRTQRHLDTSPDYSYNYQAQQALRGAGLPCGLCQFPAARLTRVTEGASRR